MERAAAAVPTAAVFAVVLRIQAIRLATVMTELTSAFIISLVNYHNGYSATDNHSKFKCID
jgi:hypothetical protein